MLFENSSNDRRFSFDHVSRFRFTIVAIERFLVALFFRSGDLKTMYANVNKCAQAINFTFGCKRQIFPDSSSESDSMVQLAI